MVPAAVRGGSAGHERGTAVRAGWVYRVGNTGPYRQRQLKSPHQTLTAKRAPEVPAGLEWVVRVVRVGTGPVHTPAGPGRPAASLAQDPRRCRLWANKGEI